MSTTLGGMPQKQVTWSVFGNTKFQRGTGLVREIKKGDHDRPESSRTGRRWPGGEEMETYSREGATCTGPVAPGAQEDRAKVLRAGKGWGGME